MDLQQKTTLLFILSGIIMLTCPVATRAGCSCPALWTSYRQNCYRLFSYQKTWHEAELFCKSFTLPSLCYDGAEKESLGHLVSIHSQDEYDFVTTLFDSARIKEIEGGTTPTKLWLGAHDNNSEAQFEWSDGTSFDFSMWAPEEPNDHRSQEDCTITGVNFGYKWNDVPCNLDYINYFICKMPIW